MFADNSRYKKVNTISVTKKDGTTVAAVKLRKLPAIKGNNYTVKKQDRLDLLANKTYKDDTKFWHVADANTELEANKLTEEANRTILLPEN
ncbi:hypothetical protein KAR34_13600 [bacterium]|nr:hypothetical protein [bacterium]